MILRMAKGENASRVIVVTRLGTTIAHNLSQFFKLFTLNRIKAT